jgi:hypothetical protein
LADHRIIEQSHRSAGHIKLSLATALGKSLDKSSGKSLGKFLLDSLSGGFDDRISLILNKYLLIVDNADQNPFALL